MGHVLQERFVQPEGFSWIKLARIECQDDKGRQRVWEAVHRITRSDSNVDGVAIFAEVLKDGQKHIVLVSQYRPPLHNLRLIDKGENASQAAIRELREKTGYVGSAVMSYQHATMTPASHKRICDMYV